jgi:polyhydroxyalkanoate synthesis regulator phasin
MYVLNKTDLLRAAELQTMSDFNIRSIAGLTDADSADIRLYPVSARQYSESVLPEEKQQSGIPAFKDALQALTLNKGHELIRASFRIRLDTLLHKTENLLRLQLAALQTPVEALERQMSQLESSLHLLSAEQEDFLLFVRGKVNKLKEEIIQTIEHRAKEIFREREQALLADDALLPILKSVASNQYLSTMIAAINQEFEALHRQVERETKERFKHLMFQYIGQSEHFLKEVATQLEKLLGVKPSILPEAFDLEVYTSFYLHAIPEHKVPDTRTNILYRLLPYEYAQKRIVKTVLKNYRDIIISNSAGMMYDMTYRMDESFRKFAADLRRTTTRITDELRNLIRTCIAKKSDTQHQIKETMANVIDNISEIEQLKSQFKAIKTSKDGPDRES